MEIKELPESVQIIAAETLKCLLTEAVIAGTEPVEELALKVKKAFVTLYQTEK
ncbi:MAG: hypothetical protein PIK35_12425 [Enterobacter roggenkampii]